MEFKKMISVILFFILMASCGGQGTEVLNTLNPSESSTKKTFQSIYFNVIFDVPEGWEYIEYNATVTPGEEAFTDIDEETETLAYFYKSDLASFTVFASQLGEDQDIFDFVRERRPEGEIQSQTAETETLTAYMLFFQQEEPGPNGGYVFDLYISVDDDILWSRAEFTGDETQNTESWNEFWDIYESVSIE